MIMAGKALLDRQPNPAPDAIRQGPPANPCPCTGDRKTFKPVARVAGKAPPAPRTPLTEPNAPSYYRPRSLEEALELMIQRAGELRPVAGGTDILVQAKDGTVDRAGLFDLSLVPELKGIDEQPGHLRIGAAVTHTEILESKLVERWGPARPIAGAWVGGPQIRNRGTIGGNVAHGSPAGDTIPPLYVADALVGGVSVSDRRAAPISEF